MQSIVGWVPGTAGPDVLLSSSDDDEIRGYGGDDIIVGWGEMHGELRDDGTDYIRGGKGSDTYVVPTWIGDEDGIPILPAVAVDAQLGNGAVTYSEPGFSRDFLQSVENIITGDGADNIVGSKGANTISVGGGANLVLAGAGDDTILGGATLLAEEPLYHVRGETLRGEDGNDTISSGGAYWHYAYLTYYAGAGAVTDRLVGGKGDDHLIGGAGRVVMTGGSGADIFEARVDVFAQHAYGTFAMVKSSLKVLDFGPDDVIHFRMGAVDDFADLGDPPLPIPDVGFDDLTIRERGGDTVVTYDYTFHTIEIDPIETDVRFRIVLKDYVGLTAEDFVFL